MPPSAPRPDDARFAPGSGTPVFARRPQTPPLITVGIPCYNRPALLAEALASLAAQKEFTDFEVVVSDDGALPETRRVVEACGVANLRFYINRPALGAVRNWNYCLAAARGIWVTILHEDDLLYPWFFKAVVPRLRADIDAVSVRCIQGPVPAVVGAPARFPAGKRYAPLWFLKAAMTPFPGVVMRREVALQLGGFDPAEGGIADYAFWYALARTGRVETLNDTCAFYRVNEGQWTEREWPTMLRRAHGLRLRIAREQLGSDSRLGRWLARFYTARMARAYKRRFGAEPTALTRARKFERIPFSGVSSGWVWAFLKVLSRVRSNTPRR